MLAGTTVICTATLVGTTSKIYSCTSASIPNAGTHNITGKYLGNATYKLSTSATRSQMISKITLSSVTLTSSSATPTQGSAFTLTATVTVAAGLTPTGTVNFRTSANTSLIGCGTVALTGTGTGTGKTATCSVTETTAGSKTYIALCSGNVNFTAGTNATVSVTVSNTTTATTLALAASTTSLTYPAQPTLTVRITPNTVNVGSVSFKRGTTDIAGCLNLLLPATATPPITVTCTPGLTGAGSYTYSASYSGGTGTGSAAGTAFGISNGSSPAVTITKTSPSSVTITGSTATPVQGTAFTGTINFRDSTNASLAGCGAVALTGTGVTKTATCSVTETTAGTKTYNALYSGDVNFTAGTNSTVSVTVTPNQPANNNMGDNSAADPVLIDIFYVHPDHLGTPRAVSNPSTNLKVWEWESTPFGETLANENPQNLTGVQLTIGQFRYNLRFPGQFFDVESGKHYNYFRGYDPATGRYMESDPIGLNGGLSTFGYVKQSPTVSIDRYGLETYMCKAPLHALGGSGARSGPDIPGNLLHHQYLCVLDKQGNSQCGGQDRSDGPFSPGKQSKDEFKKDTCESADKRPCVDSCVQAEISNPDRPYYALVGGGWRSNMMNCQQFADGVLYDCQRRCGAR